MPNPSILASEDEISVSDQKPASGFYQLVDALNTDVRLKAENLALKTSLLALGADLKTAQEGRDRVLRENCDMTQKLRDLKRVAEAALRFRKAVSNADIKAHSDGPTQELAESDALLEAKLEAAGYGEV